MTAVTAQMVDMGATERSSITVYVTMSRTYPVVPPLGSTSCTSIIISPLHTGQGAPLTLVA